ncbi:MAG: hypothetical protein GVY32_02060 [Gammaproteobacteria bacterium]|jgi:cell division septation protein DedD|nr:hypothetical protein [Gammaproteobacteria bacterium]
MDKVLKQRLVGASILIALAVIFLPMLFDGGADDRDEQRELALELPDQPSDERRIRRLALDPERVREQEPAAEPPEPVVEEPETEAVAEPATSPASGPEAAAGGAPDTAAVVDDSDQSEPAGEPAPEVDPGESSDPPAGPDPDAGEEATAAEPPTVAEEQQPAASPPPSDLDDGWSVQVAVFSNRDTAVEIVGQLEDLGHEVSVDELVRDQAELYRLRTGPYPSRAAAQRALGQINATVAGVNPELRAPDGDEGGESRQGLSAQVGSFASRNNAERLSGQLRSAGYDAFMHGEESGGRTIWRVRVGIFQERAEAERMLETLREEQGLDGIVVSHP